MKIVNYNLDDIAFSQITGRLLRDFPDKDGVCILFVKLDDLGYENRRLLRGVISIYPDAKFVIISSNLALAAFAWQIQAWHFLPYPINKTHVNVLMHKLGELIDPEADREKIRLSYKGGFKLYHPAEISVIRGQGNYCKFYFTYHKPQLFTCRINTIHSMLNCAPFICKINKSLIVNINTILEIEGGEVTFAGNPQVRLQFSRRTVAAIIEKMHWLS